MDAGIFLDHLRHSRLLDTSQFQSALVRFAGLDAAEGMAPVLTALVAEGLLTPFQVRRLCAGESRHLVLGQYRLLEELGRGGMGSVYKALHTFMDRIVAIKVILPELMQNNLAVEWFRREVRAVTQLHHPNIVMAYDANEADGLHFLVMEYVEGTNLDVRVKTEGPLDVVAACDLIREAALGLQYAHEKGLVHRDVKPANLLLPRPITISHSQPDQMAGASGPGLPAVKIVDFGLARLHSSGTGETILLKHHSEFLGTPDYCSPEQSRDIHAADIRSDLYSLGCTFYFTLAGRPPFQGETPIEKLVKHMTEEAPAIEQFRPEVPAVVASIVRRLMAKFPDHRYQTPAELAVDLAACILKLRSREPMVVGVMRPTLKRSSGCQAVVPSGPAPSATNRLERVPVYAFDPGSGGVRPKSDSLPSSPMVGETRSRSDTAPMGSKAEALPRPTPSPLTPTLFSEAPVVPSAAVGPEIGDAPRAAGSRLPDLVGRWRAWTEIIEIFVVREGFSRLQAEKYRQVYQQVLDACRAHAAAHPEKAELYQRLEAIVRPWLSLNTLRHTEQGILDALYRQSKTIEWELCGGPEPVSGGMWLLLLFLFIVPAALAMWCRSSSSGEQWLASLEQSHGWAWLQHAVHSFAVMMNQNPMYWLFGFVPAVLLLSLLALWRPRRA